MTKQRASNKDTSNMQNNQFSIYLRITTEKKSTSNENPIRLQKTKQETESPHNPPNTPSTTSPNILNP